MTLCLSLCPSVASGRIELVFRTDLQHILRYYKEIRVYMYLHSKGTSLWNFVPNFGLRKFRHGTSIVLSTKLSELVDHTYDGRRVIGLSYHIISYHIISEIYSAPITKRTWTVRALQKSAK